MQMFIRSTIVATACKPSEEAVTSYESQHDSIGRKDKSCRYEHTYLFRTICIKCNDFPAGHRPQTEQSLGLRLSDNLIRSAPHLLKDALSYVVGQRTWAKLNTDTSSPVRLSVLPASRLTDVGGSAAIATAETASALKEHDIIPSILFVRLARLRLPDSMSLGFGSGDFLAASTVAKGVHTACKDSPGDEREKARREIPCDMRSMASTAFTARKGSPDPVYGKMLPRDLVTATQASNEEGLPVYIHDPFPLWISYPRPAKRSHIVAVS